MATKSKLIPEEVIEHHRAANRKYYWSHLEYFAKKARDPRRRIKHDQALSKRGLNVTTMTADQLAAL